MTAAAPADRNSMSATVAAAITSGSSAVVVFAAVGKNTDVEAAGALHHAYRDVLGLISTAIATSTSPASPSLAAPMLERPGHGHPCRLVSF